MCWSKSGSKKTPELWCIAAITGGAIGNFIDRISSGLVIDMICIPWFSTFNVADLFITFGALILVVYILVKDKALLADEPKKNQRPGMTLTLDKTGERLDAALARLVPSLSRSQAQRLIEQGAVTHGGRPVKKKRKALSRRYAGADAPGGPRGPDRGAADPAEVCYEDADVIVVNKPKGLVVHPAPGHADGTLVNALLAHCGDSLSGIGGEKRPGIVHRIDKDTSGLIIAAKNDAAHAALAAQLKDHSLARTYVCLVCGRIRDDAGTIDAPIGRHPTDRKKMAVTQKNSRSAVTHWRVLERFAAYTLVECRLETGRTHQIRVHMAYRGHPILGDMVYGHKKPELGQSSQCLHAKELRFVHPRTGEPVTVSCGLPDYFTALLEKLRAGA